MSALLATNKTVFCNRVVDSLIILFALGGHKRRLQLIGRMDRTCRVCEVYTSRIRTRGERKRTRRKREQDRIRERIEKQPEKFINRQSDKSRTLFFVLVAIHVVMARDVKYDFP